MTHLPHRTWFKLARRYGYRHDQLALVARAMRPTTWRSGETVVERSGACVLDVAPDRLALRTHDTRGRGVDRGADGKQPPVPWESFTPGAEQRLWRDPFVAGTAMREIRAGRST